MSEEVIYRQNLYKIEEIPAADSLVADHAVAGEILISGAGEYERGELLASDTEHHFVKADKNSLLSAKEICILCEDVKVEDEDTLVMSTGYFFGAYFRRDIKLPEDAELNAEMLACLRHHGIYVR